MWKNALQQGLKLLSLQTKSSLIQNPVGFRRLSGVSEGRLKFQNTTQLASGRQGILCRSNEDVVCVKLQADGVKICSTGVSLNPCGQRLISTSTESFSQLSDLLERRLRISATDSSTHSNIPNRGMATLQQMHRTGPHKKFRPPRKPLDGKPMMKGVILKTVVKKPKKPNSANRKCVLVRLTNGKEAVAYVPGVGHNLQEHNIVLVRVGRLQDVPGVKLKCIRGVYDLPHPQKPQK